MRVIDPRTFANVPKQTKRSTRKIRYAMLTCVLVGYVCTMLLRPVPSIQAQINVAAISAHDNYAVQWPAYGQSAVGAVGYGVLATHGEQQSVPTASMAKVITALAVLKKRPLAVGEAGPTITYDQDDVDELARVLAVDGSHNLVARGAEITQYQALQALLLPSSNNMAYTLSKWAFGSQEEYIMFANSFVQSLGMDHTAVADASGFSANTVSTASDLTRLAVNAMDNPVLAEIVRQPSADIPVAGRIYNVNNVLGTNGIIGLKTGNTDQAGGCFMAAAERMIGHNRVVVVSVIMGAPTRTRALSDSVPLVTSILDGFDQTTVVTKGQKLGTVTASWGHPVDVHAAQDIQGLHWSGSSLKPTYTIDTTLQTVVAGSPVGTIEAQFGRDTASSQVIVDRPIGQPSILWRLRP